MRRGNVRTLLVASGGGHLTELLTLLPRIGVPASRCFVTYDVPQALDLLHGEEVILAHHPTTKNLPNAFRNYGVARRLLRRRDFACVISTGAAVAVPFMIRARQLGISAYYIESATRVKGPSLTGRILERIPGIHLYRQLGDWGAPRWQPGPSVFDGFATSKGDIRQPQRAVVTLGTHGFGFPSLLLRLQELFGDLRIDDVTWQVGTTRPPPTLSGRIVERLPDHELMRTMATADVVVSHAGVGLAVAALTAGKMPVLVPRRVRRREHTDDHQVQLSDELQRNGLVVASELEDLTSEHLKEAASGVVVYDEPPAFDLIKESS